MHAAVRCTPRLRWVGCGRHHARAVRVRVASEGGSGAMEMVHVHNPKFRRLHLDESLGSFDAPAPEDFYSLLSLDLNATPDDIKSAYRRLQRMVHPDIAGPSATTLAVILNACYDTLMHDEARNAYNFALKQFRKGVGSFDGRPVSLWMGGDSESRAVFVAENECIGCQMCTSIAPSTFMVEEEHGRARVTHQWADDEDMIREAVDSCPVDCIYFVPKGQLPLLEFVMKGCKRESVAIMGRRRSGNMGSAPATECPFNRAASYVKARKDAKVEEVLGADGARARAHDEVLAAAIAKAWLQLPRDVREKAWPEWASKAGALTF